MKLISRRVYNTSQPGRYEASKEALMRSVLLFVLATSAIAATNPPSAQFAARRDYFNSKSDGAQLVQVADINGDKIPDIVAIDPNNREVWTLLGNGQRHLPHRPHVTSWISVH